MLHRIIFLQLVLDTIVPFIFESQFPVINVNVNIKGKPGKVK